MYTVTDVRSVGGSNCDTDNFLVRVRCMNKIMKMQERYNKRKKCERGERVEDAVVILRRVIPVVCRKTSGEVNFSHETQLWYYVL